MEFRWHALAVIAILAGGCGERSAGGSGDDSSDVGGKCERACAVTDCVGGELGAPLIDCGDVITHAVCERGADGCDWECPAPSPRAVCLQDDCPNAELGPPLMQCGAVKTHGECAPDTEGDCNW